jgi:predicted RNA binding protein YcfA (HicA-like mRNA interferase family)
LTHEQRRVPKVAEEQRRKFDRSRGKGSHMYLTLNGKTTVMPTHSTEMRTGTVESIKRQLGLKGEK